ncbi:MAG: hypothetical protein EXR86_12370 [Gammaproteobacteria bacterium]|nr:hypothetical protein [Gammaproteobacteria bacterium]
MLTFDPQAHVYRVDGEVVPSVTQILEHAGMISAFCKDPLAAERGSRVHEACALLAQNQLDLATLDERIMGYVLSYAAFLGAASNWTLIRVEQRVFEPLHQYAGTYDALFHGWLIDLKSGGPAKWHALQLAAYHHAARLDPRFKRATLYLDSTGKLPRLVEHKDRTDLPTFLKLLEEFRANGN